MHLGFISNLGKMVTVDTHGFINVWKYDREHVTDFSWFFPGKKYKLDLNKTMYSPLNSDRPKLLFTDRGRSKKTTQAQIAKERRAAEQSLRRLKLSDPWHVTSSENPPLQTAIFVPPGGSEGAGALFNVVVRHTSTQQLCMHVTRSYRPVKVPSSKLVKIAQTPSGEELVFVLLFPEYPPKGPHLMILVLDLLTMKLRNFRKDLPLTAKQFTDVRDSSMFSAGVSQVYGPTGSNYLFITLCGTLNCVSLNSAAEVLTVDNVARPKVPRFPGLKLDYRQVALNMTHQVAVLGNLGSLYAVLYEKNSSNIKVLRLEDSNNHEDSRLMCKAYERWQSFNLGTISRHAKAVHFPSELRINPLHSSLPDMKHKEAEMRSLILKLPYTSDPLTHEDQEFEKIGNYLSLEGSVHHAALLNDL
ncbi:reverse transcriptase [Plakobranchus ocellatus]|uniref:Reverse transcriptase n=1 Tax=Plakobranchus ocellatus TaxID=259542 RepID=A0AAV3XV02_9GAST|nr:reverse transcriptase [Plakobranchus ocellatus]